MEQSSLSTVRKKTGAGQNRGGVTGPSTVSAPHETDGPARFALSAGTVATRPGPLSPEALGANLGPGEPDPADEREVNVPARLLSSSPLAYPQAARQAGIELDFPVEIVVEANGRVTAARALSRVGYGLDEAAIRAIRGRGPAARRCRGPVPLTSPAHPFSRRRRARAGPFGFGCDGPCNFVCADLVVRVIVRVTM